MDDADFRPTVGIIGGRGRMGRWLEARLSEAGHRVLIADACLGPTPREMVQASDVLILSVPVPQVEAVMAEVGPFTRPDGLVMDIASLKQGPVGSMLAHARGEVIGTHPLCGPAAPSLQGQLVFFHPARSSHWLKWALEFWRQGGARVVEMEPREHDRLMARVQTLRHVLLFAWGRALMRLDFQVGPELDLAGPWFQTLFDLLAQQSQQPAELYADLALHNPAGPAAVQALQDSLQEMADCLRGGDGEAVAGLFREVSRYVRQGLEQNLT